jgi:hypothetical protein
MHKAVADDLMRTTENIFLLRDERQYSRYQAVRKNGFVTHQELFLTRFRIKYRYLHRHGPKSTQRKRPKSCRFRRNPQSFSVLSGCDFGDFHLFRLWLCYSSAYKYCPLARDVFRDVIVTAGRQETFTGLYQLTNLHLGYL